MSFLDLFRNWKDVEEFPAQTVIYSEGAAARVMYVILAGEVELTLHGEPLGKERKGGIIGEMAIIKSAKRSSTATVLKDVRMARLNRDQFRKLIAENSEFSLHVMAVLANRLRAVDKYISSQFKQLK